MEKLSLTVFIHVTIKWICVHIFMCYHPPNLRFREYLNKNSMKLDLVPWNINALFFPPLHVYGKRLLVNHRNSNLEHFFQWKIFAKSYFFTELLTHLSAGCSLGKYPYIFHSPPARALSLSEKEPSHLAVNLLWLFTVEAVRLDTSFKYEFENRRKVMLAHGAWKVKISL